MKKILVIRFSSIGDIVLTTPVIRCLKTQLPGAEIHYLTKEQFVPILKENPFIDKLHFIRNEISEVIPELRQEHFDHIIDLHGNFRSVGVRMRLRRPASTFPKVNFQKWLLVNLKIHRLPGKHVVDRYFEATAKLNVKNDKQGLDYFIPKEDMVSRNELPGEFHDSFVVFVIGGKHYTKCLPEDKIISICRKISRPVMLMGGKEDAGRGERISDLSGEHVFNACGLYSINQSAAVLKMADKVITHDTGLMHIAAAFDKDIISIWGNTVPDFGMYPYTPQHKGGVKIIQVEGLSCRPCSKIGFDKCPKKHFDCMNLIDEDQIIHAVGS